MEDNRDVKAETILEKLKHYLSVFLGTLCLVSIFAFCLLVPFVIDPAILTLSYDFVDTPATCKVASVNVIIGKNACKWSSCKEGCTTDMYECWQIRVRYSKQPFVNDSSIHKNYIPERDWQDIGQGDPMNNIVIQDTPLLVNAKGCGYPPEVSCPSFAQKYSELKKEGKYFPCYYSNSSPWIVIERYNYDDTLYAILTSILVPNGLFIVSFIILLYWHSPYCKRKNMKYDEKVHAGESDEENESIINETN